MPVPSSQTSGRAAAMLAALLLAVGLATSRLGLVGHELVGHGGTAMATGGRILDAGLFWFAGGWIRYRVPDASLADLLAIALGGIAIEIVVGATLWIALARRTSLAARIARGVGGALVIHATCYLATGTWHGYGDGTLLRKTLDDSTRIAIGLGAGALSIVMAYAVARRIFGTLLGTLPGPKRARIVALACAMLVAGGVQAALAVGEVQLRRDVTYGVIMQPEQQRVVAAELARWAEEQARRGVAIDDGSRSRREAELAAQHRDFPFKWVLGALLAIAIVIGCARSPMRDERPVDRRLVLRAALLAAGSLALVIVLDALLGV